VCTLSVGLACWVHHQVCTLLVGSACWVHRLVCTLPVGSAFGVGNSMYHLEYMVVEDCCHGSEQVAAEVVACRLDSGLVEGR
jgi:hypothetical protein